MDYTNLRVSENNKQTQKKTTKNSNKEQKDQAIGYMSL